MTGYTGHVPRARDKVGSKSIGAMPPYMTAGKTLGMGTRGEMASDTGTEIVPPSKIVKPHCDAFGQGVKVCPAHTHKHTPTYTHTPWRVHTPAHRAS